MPLILESELSPATAEQGTLTDSKSAGTVTEAPGLYGASRGLFFRDMNRHDTTNYNRQNKRKNNMQNGNERRQLVVDNKVRYSRI